MNNPFRAKAIRARERANRLNQPSTHDRAMEAAFPLGAGRGGKQRPGAAKRIDASVKRAGEAVAARLLAVELEAKADAFDRGRINAQGRSINAGTAARREKRQKAEDSRSGRVQAAKDAVDGKEPWQVTKAVWTASKGVFGGGAKRLFESEHREAVELALAAGNPVPDDVRKEFEESNG